ncbi:MKI67 FHA domain-interacting nucleolar phosphoprotein, putative [Entamoeba dispar SAW760]|uniref:MKI67 FHA domain-interacting nucleolar phosphoprotein, putative n=1 Tax=Entamoeba dispar (strain ATCC PRA-260 / SAW760) TaxID=370354 RepID=B0EFW4_ENTDS|nr:MKI67 FHA domain-interacting nucleolar phosphoprotein, putative [Entamoeba dispar SAW760]EDR26570.1 MKI67 FHA domain-interacting nucleolar phosphoprotein, putative [Entamoeba dispar SAW760]|eukprot:EDR26570.1 MKI67 FHA domain-interacting nucleolar phosphoprotein, putative [Entamoeba dispar SAW760]
MQFESSDFAEITPKDVEANKPIVRIRNLPKILDEYDLRRYFSQYGELKGLAIKKTDFGISKGTCVVKFADCVVARIVAETLNNHILENQLLQTELCEAKKRRFHSTYPVPKGQRKTEPKIKVITQKDVDERKASNEELRKKLEELHIDFDFPQ